jgi:ATPase subunit of ABC transporter with duplicated ATPase domains
MGQNGAGKSTLLKPGRRPPGSPTPAPSSLGASVKIGYFAQHTMELLDPT